MRVLVKDVVSASLFDLHAAGLIALFWTPEIESETIEHRARLRAENLKRPASDADLEWASARMEMTKRYLVHQPVPEGWVMEETLNDPVVHAAFASLFAIPDQDDVHVAIGAAYLAAKLGRPVVLTTVNLDDLPQT